MYKKPNPQGEGVQIIARDKFIFKNVTHQWVADQVEKTVDEIIDLTQLGYLNETTTGLIKYNDLCRNFVAVKGDLNRCYRWKILRGYRMFCVNGIKVSKRYSMGQWSFLCKCPDGKVEIFTDEDEVLAQKLAVAYCYSNTDYIKTASSHHPGASVCLSITSGDLKLILDHLPENTKTRLLRERLLKWYYKALDKKQIIAPL